MRTGSAVLAALVAIALHSPASDLAAQGRLDTPAAAPRTAPAKTASYDIDVRLDPAARTITGREVITWRNPGQIPAFSIRLHLYWNAFRNTRST